MASSVLLKRSAVASKVPLTTDLALGEIAINTYDGKLFIKKDNGTQSIVEIGAGGGGGATDLSFSANGSTVSINSSTGADIVVPGANSSVAGFLTAEAQTIGGIKTFSANSVFSTQVKLGGTSGAMTVGHNGTYGFLLNTTGGTDISGSGINLIAGDGSITHATFSAAGGAQLRFDDVIRLSTTGAGASVNGILNTSGSVTIDTASDHLTLKSAVGGDPLARWYQSTTYAGAVQFVNSDTSFNVTNIVGSATVKIRGGQSGLTFRNGANTYIVWHAGNDGAGSGLDADLLDGLNAASLATASTIVARDASGNFSANTIIATLTGNASSANEASAVTVAAENTTNATYYPLFSTVTAGTVQPKTDTGYTYNPSTNTLTTSIFAGALSGNASTATTLQTARNINGVSFNGSSDITITAANPNALTIGTGLSGTSYNGSAAVTIAIDSTVATLSGSQTLTNKTISGGILTGTLTANSSVGSAGQVLTSTGTGIYWANAASGPAGVVSVSDTAPGSPTSGDLWFDSTDASFNIYYSDGTSSQWINAVNNQNDPVFRVKTANYTASNRDQIIADTSAGSFTITLPASPISGTAVTIFDNASWGVNNLTIARNGSTIEGIADDFVLDVSSIKVEFIYNGSTWQVYSSIGQSGAAAPTVTTSDVIALAIALG